MTTNNTTQAQNRIIIFTTTVSPQIKHRTDATKIPFHFQGNSLYQKEGNNKKEALPQGKGLFRVFSHLLQEVVCILFFASQQ